MRRTRYSLICDPCEQDDEIEEPATRIIVVGDDGQVRSLDLCDTHDGNVRPTQLKETAEVYGTLLKPYVTSKGRLATVSNGHAREPARDRSQFHEPGGAWEGSYVGPATCMVKVTSRKTCGVTCKNVIGLKKHQWMKHGITVKR